ncbi:hypothetical protein MATL_G00088060 [Megalops atlanticus]|uniref:Ig-like domain-containing protein n=1 Tax=Megalops atlanticus TaxID=7932 RepID=A0A9D3Q7Q7_MEGAT|nr:hypothetical protein MATL_G00088060 [Megalops atlanticus]
MSDKKKEGKKKGKKDKTDAPASSANAQQAEPKLKEMRSMEAGEGKKTSLRCEARAGNPVPKFKWYKDGKEFAGKNKPKDVKIKKKKGGMISELLFRKATESNSGSYTCEAINDLGSDKTTGNLSIISAPAH